MEMSDSIVAIAKALNKFQAEVENVKKDGTNPFFKSKYATLENFISTIKSPMEKNGLSFSQFPDENGLTTIIMHTSGEYMKATAQMMPKDETPQGQGSAITYMRRYALGAALGIATEEDDDGNQASKAPKEPAMKPYAVPRKEVATDDEPGSKQFMEPDEITEVLKVKIRHLMGTLGMKPTKENVKTQTGLVPSNDNYPAIVEKLELLVKSVQEVKDFDKKEE